jgi:hypothetical protein
MCLGVFTGKNPEDSSQASVGATQWILLYLSICHMQLLFRISRTAQLKYAGAQSCMYSILSAATCKLNVSGHVLLWTFYLVSACGTRAQGLSASFSLILRKFTTRILRPWKIKNCSPLLFLKLFQVIISKEIVVESCQRLGCVFEK